MCLSNECKPKSNWVRQLPPTVEKKISFQLTGVSKLDLLECECREDEINVCEMVKVTCSLGISLSYAMFWLAIIYSFHYSILPTIPCEIRMRNCFLFFVVAMTQNNEYGNVSSHYPFRYLINTLVVLFLVVVPIMKYMRTTGSLLICCEEQTHKGKMTES